MNSTSNHYPGVSWHALDVDGTFHRIAGSREGLTHEEAVKRMSEYGPNKLSPSKKRSPVTRFRLQFHNVLIYVRPLTVAPW